MSYDDWKTTEPSLDPPPYEDDDYDHEDERDFDDPGDPRPMFGCACEDPLVIDDCCGWCQDWLKEQGRPGKLRRGKVAAALYKRHSKRQRRAVRPVVYEEIPF